MLIITDKQLRIHSLPLHYRSKIRLALRGRDFKVTLKNCFVIEQKLSNEMTWSRIARAFLTPAQFGEFMQQLPFIKADFRESQREHNAEINRDIYKKYGFYTWYRSPEVQAERARAWRANCVRRKKEARLFWLLSRR